MLPKSREDLRAFPNGEFQYGCSSHCGDSSPGLATCLYRWKIYLCLWITWWKNYAILTFQTISQLKVIFFRTQRLLPNRCIKFRSRFTAWKMMSSFYHVWVWSLSTNIGLGSSWSRRFSISYLRIHIKK